MTKIYIYSLFGRDDVFCGPYSSLKAAHRDALKIVNKGASAAYIETEDGYSSPTLSQVRNIFKGKCDIVISYRGEGGRAKIIKNQLKE
jgi:hypothetical protein